MLTKTMLFRQTLREGSLVSMHVGYLGAWDAFSAHWRNEYFQSIFQLHEYHLIRFLQSLDFDFALNCNFKSCVLLIE